MRYPLRRKHRLLRDNPPHQLIYQSIKMNVSIQAKCLEVFLLEFGKKHVYGQTFKLKLGLKYILNHRI